MEIKFTAPNDGFVVISLAEYARLKEIEKEAHELYEEKIKRLLKGS